MISLKKPLKKPIWLKYTETEVKEIISKIVEKNPEITAEKIGLILRDNYGIPTTKIYGFKIGKVLKENKKYESPDIKNLKAKVENIERHGLKNKGDKKASRALIIARSNLKKVKDYSK